MQKVKKVFSRFGFAQLAGMAAIMLLSLAVTPYVNTESLEKLVSGVGPSVLLLLTYVPNFLFFEFAMIRKEECRYQKNGIVSWEDELEYARLKEDDMDLRKSVMNRSS